jgi:hypothetical protein
MEALNKKPTESKTGDRVYSTLGLAACLGVFVVAVSFHFDRALLCAVDHLLP